jgi:glycosyltransferase involved in cell wall biosynthesis
VCGDGPDASRLRLLARARGLEDRVEFRGWVERAEVLRTMREEASVFVFPSLHDEAGWVVAEAMASGLPVVCLDLGGPPTLAGRRMAVKPAGSKVTAERIAQRVLKAATETNPESIRERASECLFGKRLDRLETLLRTRRLLAAFQSREATSQIAAANGRAAAR